MEFTAENVVEICGKRINRIPIQKNIQKQKLIPAQGVSFYYGEVHDTSIQYI